MLYILEMLYILQLQMICKNYSIVCLINVFEPS